MTTTRLVAALVWLAALLATSGARAHDIPSRIDLHAFVKPDGDRVEMTVRVPLVMLLNLKLPKDGLGFLALSQIAGPLQRATGIVGGEVELSVDGEVLRPSLARGRISLPSEDAFSSHAAARAHVLGPALPVDAKVFWNQGYLDAYFEYPLQQARPDLAVQLLVAPGLKNTLRLHLRYLTPGGDVLAYEIGYGDGRVVLDPDWTRAAGTFVRLGAEHILQGPDHLLFLLCLVAPFQLRHLWRLVGIVSAFTVGHSVTLIAAASGNLSAGPWLAPLVELLIPVSILYMAIENVLAGRLAWRWLVAGLFGLVHGFAFSYALQDRLQFAGDHLYMSLAAFNVGVELGQLAVMVPVVAVLSVLFTNARRARQGLILLSLIAGHASWHWMMERLDALSTVDWSTTEAAKPAGLLFVLAAAIVGLGIVRSARRRGPARAPD